MNSSINALSRLWEGRWLSGVLLALILLSGSALPVKAEPLQAPVPAPVKAEVIVNSSGAHWSNVSIKVTNSLSKAIDVRNVQVDFSTPAAVNSVWGSFPSVSYPGQIKVNSLGQNGELFRTSVVLNFASDSWINTSLKPGTHFTLQFGLPLLATSKSVSNIKVFPEKPVIADGAITLNAPQAPGAEVSSLKAKVMISGAGEFERIEELAWGSTKTLSSLAYGDYVVHVQQVGPYPPARPTVPVTLSSKSKSAEVTWNYEQAVYPAEMTVTLPADDLKAESTLYLRDESGSVNTYVLANGSTHTLNNLVSGKAYTAYFSSYRINNQSRTLSLNGSKELNFVANKDKAFAPTITKVEEAVDTSGFKAISVQLEGLPETANVEVKLAHSDGDLYQHTITSGEAVDYDSLKPGVYAVQLPDVEMGGKTYRSRQNSTVSVVEAGTLTFAYATSSLDEELLLAPYKDVSLNVDWAKGEMASLTDLAKKSGNQRFTLAFILGNEWDKTSCKALWGGQPTMSVEKAWGKSSIDQFRAAGGDVIISFGGANGHYLSQSCQTADALYDQYKLVVDTYGVKHLDFDMEMGRENDAPAMNRMITALARLQKTVPDLKVSFTLAGAPDTIRGFHLVEQSVAAGIDVDSVNPMTMSFGQWYHDAMKDDTAELSIMTIEHLKGLMKKVYPDLDDAQLYRKMGMIPMQGINDVTADHINLQQAEKLAQWSKDKGLRYLSFWSIDRDHPCSQEFASPTCSGAKNGVQFQTESWEFSKAFLKYLDK